MMDEGQLHNPRHYDIIICGAGASGLLTAYEMSRRPFFRDKQILIIERDAKDSDDRTWSYWEAGSGDWDELLHQTWQKILVKDGIGSIHRDISPYSYKCLRSSAFYAKVKQELSDHENINIKREEVQNIHEGTAAATVHCSTQSYTSAIVLNSIPAPERYRSQEKHPVLAQHFLGWFVRCDAPIFTADTVTFMDFSIEQNGNTRFMYVLPTSAHEALVEYTLFSEQILERSEYEDAIKAYLQAQGATNYTIEETEQGVIPMTAFDFSAKDSAHIHHIGTAGGWTKASSGYTFSPSMRKAKALVDAIAESRALKTLKSRSRFDIYDSVLLDVLSANNELGADLFGRMFRAVDVRTNLKFLDEETHFFEELKILSKMPQSLFRKAAFKRIFSRGL